MTQLAELDNSVVESILDGQRVGEPGETSCENCNKPLHVGEEVTIEVAKEGDLLRVGRINCGGCGSKDFKGFIAKARTSKLSIHGKQMHCLAVQKPLVVKRNVEVYNR